MVYSDPCGLLALMVAFAGLSEANTEKTTFQAPAAADFSTDFPTLDSLCLDVLTPTAATLRTKIYASSPVQSSIQETSTWLLLYNLTAAQWHEVRICWSATQPTDFSLDTFEPDHVLADPHLVTSLAVYSETRRHVQGEGGATYCANTRSHEGQNMSVPASALLLRITAKANFFSESTTDMSNPHPVFADIVLDPYLRNFVPSSLSLVTAYIFVVAVSAFVVSSRIRSWVCESPCAVTGPLKKLI